MTFIFLFSGCTAVRDIPLLKTDTLRIDVAQFAKTGPEFVPADITNGLSFSELAAIAVIGNPDLVAQRKRVGVAEAQLFSTRLLPDLQFAANVDKPTENIAGLVNARSTAVNYDIVSLLARRSDVLARENALQQVKLDLVWQEWQVAQQARLLFVPERSQSAKLDLLNTAVDRFRVLQEESSRALDAANLTITDAGPSLTALLDVYSQQRLLEQQQIQTRQSLNALIGLAPEAGVDLEPLPQLPSSVLTIPSNYMEQLVNIRPDLIALQSGYASQEAQIRSATMRSFPSIGVSFGSARDTGNISTTGLGVSLTLPFFNGSRGEIKIQEATREQLYAEYTARLAQVRFEVANLQDQLEVLNRYLVILRDYLPELESMASEARSAYDAGNIDILTFLNLEFSNINKQVELVDLERLIWENMIVLDTILARPPSF